MPAPDPAAEPAGVAGEAGFEVVEQGSQRSDVDTLRGTATPFGCGDLTTASLSRVNRRGRSPTVPSSVRTPPFVRSRRSSPFSCTDCSAPRSSGSARRAEVPRVTPCRSARWAYQGLPPCRGSRRPAARLSGCLRSPAVPPGQTWRPRAAGGGGGAPGQDSSRRPGSRCSSWRRVADPPASMSASSTSG